MKILRKSKKIIFAIAGTLFLFCFFSCTKKISSQDKAIFPVRIVSLSPASTEILFAVGAGNQIAAASELSDYPPEAKALPSAGGFDGKTLSIERILSFSPDFLYLTDGMHNHFVSECEKYGIAYYISTGNSVDDVKKEIIDIANITGHSQTGKEIISQIDGCILQAKANLAANDGHKKSVYWEVWNSPYMSAGKKSFIHDVIETAGGINIFSDIQTAYPTVSEETIIVRQPEVILIPQTSGATKESVAKRNGWQSIPAVKNDRIFIVDDNLLTRAGPRIGQSILLLSKILADE